MLDRQFHAVLDSAPDGVLIESGERIAYLNPAYARILGYDSPAALTPATIREIAHPDDLERLCWFGRQREEGKPAPSRYTFRARHRSGDTVTLDASVSVARDGGEMLITTIVRGVEPGKPRPVAVLPGIGALSAREREVIEHLLAGRRSKEIALLLEVSDKTIWTHRARAFQKLALRGVADLFRLAAEAGIIAAP